MSDHSQIHPIYHIEAEWLHLIPSIVLISQDHPNYRVGEIDNDLSVGLSFTNHANKIINRFLCEPHTFEMAPPTKYIAKNTHDIQLPGLQHPTKS